ncbi:aminopeptidase [soil metagenome]
MGPVKPVYTDVWEWSMPGQEISLARPRGVCVSSRAQQKVGGVVNSISKFLQITILSGHMKRRSLFIWSTAVLLLTQVACSPIYVIRAGYEEAKILSRRQPIQRLVEDPTTPPEQRGKLALVLEARAFAADSLNLDVGRSYTTFSQLESDTLAFVLSAAHQDRFQAHTWWFPIVGRVPYKGFFSERSARREMARLESRGFDTYLRTTSAFSTLGWFNDPLVSSLLRYDSVSLANTVIHELFHNTMYLPGQATFNESMAQFVGGRGAIMFFCGPAYGEASAECVRARDAWHDELIFGEFLDALIGELESLYSREDLTLEETLVLREEIFRRSQQEFASFVRPRLRVSSYAGFTQNPLNNATLAARRMYYHRLDLFDQLYAASGESLPLTIQRILGVIEGAADPFQAVEQLAAAG